MKRFFLFIPGLLAIFPPLFLFFNNRDVISVPLYVFLSAVFCVGTVVFFCLLVVMFFIKDDQKAVILTSVAVIAIFYYGYFFEIIKMAQFGNFAVDRHRQAILIWSAVIFITGFLVWRLKNAYFLCKTAGIFIIVLFTVFFISFAIDSTKVFSQKKEAYPLWDAERAFSLDYVNSFLGYVPDVYYIVPDAYENASILKNFFGYDNREFISYLEQKGFSVVENSESNYPSTLLSVPATLNMEYMDPSTLKSLSKNSLPARKIFFEESRTAMIFKSLGYKYVAIASDNTSFSGNKADIRFGPSILFRLLIKPTIFDPFSQRFRNRVLGAFNSFDKASSLAGPKFVLAHIISPHDPYVFGPNGEKIGVHYIEEPHSEKEMKLYLNQVKFVNKELEKSIDAILKNSKRDPVIIIQSDHGFFLPDSYGEENVRDARFKNLSAFFLPKKMNDLPVSNINTFRFIFDRYFGTSFGLLEDKRNYTEIFN
jgi:hypothetical protein